MMLGPHVTSEQATRSFQLASSAITNEMFAKEPNDAGVEVAVKGRSVKAGRIGTKTRQVRRELRRARCQEDKVTGRNGVMSGLPGRLLAVMAVFFGSTFPPPNSDRQISRGIWTSAKPSRVNI